MKGKEQAIDADNDRDELPFDDSLGYLFRDTHRLISRRLHEQLERVGIGLGQWYLLRALWQEDGVTQRDLSARIGMGEPNAVTALRALEIAGLVKRKIDTTDNRRKLVKLTPKGRAMQARLMPVAHEINAVVGGVLTPEERTQLLALIQRVRRGLLD